MNSSHRRPHPTGGRAGFYEPSVPVEYHDGDSFEQVCGVAFGLPSAGAHESAHSPLDQMGRGFPALIVSWI